MIQRDRTEGPLRSFRSLSSLSIWKSLLVCFGAEHDEAETIVCASHKHSKALMNKPRRKGVKRAPELCLEMRVNTAMIILMKLDFHFTFNLHEHVKMPCAG
jgi:hypothetical protein